MDTGLGEFAPVSNPMAALLKQKTLKDKVFELGEVIQIKASKFKITNIGRHTLTLRLIQDDSQQQIS